MVYPTYADLARPAWKPLGLLYDFLLVSGASLLIAVSAQIAIPLPFTPVPLTLQTLVVLAAGVVLGSSRGTLAVTLYLLEGCAGLPVFSGAASGITHLLGPTGGYLLGFLPFIPGDLLKTAIAVGLVPAIWRLLPCPPCACSRRW